jgi:limonene-1,2-epoxide hydrolase
VRARLRQLTSTRRALAAVAAVAVIAAVVALVASGGDKGPPPVSGTPAEAVATVEAFQRALSERDFATICDRLFTPRARRAAGGDNCQSVLAQAAARLRTPTVHIRSVVVQRGGRAIVGVAAKVAGERPVPDLIHLERSRGRFRIASVGTAVPSGDD